MERRSHPPAHAATQRRAARLARSVPWMRLEALSERLCEMTADRIRQSIETLGGRGVCADAVAAAARQRPVLAVAGACPPSTRRALQAAGAGSAGWAARVPDPQSGPDAARARAVACASIGAGSWALRSMADERPRARSFEPISNHRCPPAVLWAAAGSSDWVMRMYAASNPATGPALLAVLSADPDNNVRSAAAANPAAGPGLLAVLGADPDSSVRSAAAANPAAGPGLLTMLGSDPEDDVAKAAFTNPACDPATLSGAARSSDPARRRQAATNPACGARLLLWLAEDADRRVRYAAIANPSCPSASLTTAADSLDSRVRYLAAANPNTPSDVLAGLAEEQDLYIRRVVVTNLAASTRLVEQIVNDAAVAVAGAEPDTPEPSPEQPDPQFGLRAAAARNPNCPPWLLEELTTSSDPQENGACVLVARHPCAPLRTLAALGEHPDPAVARTAIRAFAVATAVDRRDRPPART